ncbi:MAG: 16S rRNA (guanine(527)-N(7))-methyltransferase RsmG [Acidimicrobiia bacterium]
MEPSSVIWVRCCEWAGLHPTDTQLTRLARYRDWLLTEAVEAGGVGPNESERIDNRHIGDSLLFAGGFDVTPTQVLDVGSGVGLPGIPLSIVLPDTSFVLLDRSGRRVELMRRVSRVLDLPNVQVVLGDISDWQTTMDGIVSRAGFSPDKATTIFTRLLKPGGTAVIGGSWSSPPVVTGFDLLEVPVTVLDQRVWLLIMRPL